MHLKVSSAQWRPFCLTSNSHNNKLSCPSVFTIAGSMWCPSFCSLYYASCCVVYCSTCLMLARWDSALRWRHNEPGGVSNHRCLDCLLNHLFRRRSKKRSKLRVYIIVLCVYIYISCVYMIKYKCIPVHLIMYAKSVTHIKHTFANIAGESAALLLSLISNCSDISKLTFWSSLLPLYLSERITLSAWLRSHHMTIMAFQIAAIRELAQQFVRADIKETPKPRFTGSLFGESTGDRWIPLAKGQ